MTMKQCSRCHGLKPATTDIFYKCSKAADGLTSQCKDCTRIRMGELKSAKPDRPITPMEYNPRPAIAISDGVVGIPLTRGKVTLVDACDADLAAFKWCAAFSKSCALHGMYSARRSIRDNGKKKTVLLHRVILERVLGRQLEGHELVDHCDNNPLNNQRGNLRLANANQNSWNKKKTVLNKSGYKGVHWVTREQRWHAEIFFFGKGKSLGYYDDPLEAHKAYCEAAKKYHGEFANFGDAP